MYSCLSLAFCLMRSTLQEKKKKEEEKKKAATESGAAASDEKQIRLRKEYKNPTPKGEKKGA